MTDKIPIFTNSSQEEVFHFILGSLQSQTAQAKSQSQAKEDEITSRITRNFSLSVGEWNHCEIAMKSQLKFAYLFIPFYFTTAEDGQ